MENNNTKIPAVFTPDNEPYLGRESVFNFDQVIISCLEANHDVAAYTHDHQLNELQTAACQIIPQGISIALSIRELVRQGYLFSAAILMRPLIERAAVISYLCENPNKVSLWRDGWRHGKRPGLAEMLSTMNKKAGFEQTKQICDHFNHLVHGDPIGALSNLVTFGDKIGYATGKILTDPDFCDEICSQSYLYLIVIMGRMAECFPGVKSPKWR